MDRFDSDGDVRQYARQLEAIVESSTDPLLVKDLDGRYEFVNGAAADLLDRDRAEIVGATDEELFGEAVARDVRRREERVIETETTRRAEETLPVADGERAFETTRAPYYDAEGDLAGTVCVRRDVTDQRARERALEARRDELATLARINEVAREVIRTLIGEPGREEIERAVCDRLAESELYELAWIGEPDRSNAGLDDVVGTDLDEQTRAVVSTIDASEDSDEPVPKAYYTGRTQVVPCIREESSLPERRREGLLESGIRSGIAVPIRHGDATYGVLAVGSGRESAFSDREADAFDVLGEVIGFAIGAVKHRRLALSDTVVELELRLTDEDSFYVAASEELSCTIRLEGTSAGPDGSLLFYNAVSGASREALADVAEDWDAVENLRLVSDRDEESLFEVTVSGSSLVLTLSEYGARTRAAVAEDGDVTVVAHCPADADVRELVERARSKFPAVELVAKRETGRDLRTSRGFRRNLTERLTDAQENALRASYFAGYYEWPRESTAEEIAESLGVASPTFHQHIRKAQRELLGALLDDEDDRP